MENSLEVEDDHKILIDTAKLINWQIIENKILDFLNDDDKINSSTFLPIHLICHIISTNNAPDTHTINKVCTIYKGH